MSVTWYTLSKDGAPISGDPAEFGAVAADFRRIRSHADDLNIDFIPTGSTGSHEFAGEAARALQLTMKSMSSQLRYVPLIADQIQTIFQSHEDELRDLRREAGSALARAQTRWNARQDAIAEQDACQVRLRSIDQQLRWLDSSGTIEDEAARSRLHSRHSATSQHLSAAKSKVTRTEGLVDASRQDWHNLYEDELQLNRRTVDKLDNVDLWVLADPGMIDEFLKWVGGRLGEILDAIREVVAYVTSGRVSPGSI